MQPFATARRRRHRAEAFIQEYGFPASVMRKVTAAHPELRPRDVAAVETGLREWLTCCAYRDGDQLGMPSAAVDWAWHEFILNTPAYHAFCRRAFGEYLHHVPESDMAVPMRHGLWRTVLAWDRSEAGREGRQPSLWDLDASLGLPEPIGVPAAERRHAREAGRDMPPRPRSGRGADAGAAFFVGGDVGGFGGGHGGGHGAGHGCGGGGGGCGGGGGGCGGGGG